MSVAVWSSVLEMERIRQRFDRGVCAVRAAWNRAGTGGVAMLALRAPPVPRELLFVHELDILRLVDLDKSALDPLDGGYEFATADASILEELVECTDAPPSVDARRRILAKVLELSSACITVRHQGRVVAYFCAFARKYLLTFDDYGPRTLALMLGDADVFLGNAFVRPEYRKQGLFAHLVRDFIERYPKGTRFFGHVDSDNVLSFDSHRRLGFVPLLTVTCLALGPARFFFQRPFGGRRPRRIAPSATLRLVEQEADSALVPGATPAPAALTPP